MTNLSVRHDASLKSMTQEMRLYETRANELQKILDSTSLKLIESDKKNMELSMKIRDEERQRCVYTRVFIFQRFIVYIESVTIY